MQNRRGLRALSMVASWMVLVAIIACGGSDEEEGDETTAEESGPPQPYVESSEGGWTGMLYQFAPAWSECPAGDQVPRGRHDTWRHCVHSLRAERAGEGATVTLTLTRHVYDEEGYMRRMQVDRGDTVPGGPLPESRRRTSSQTEDYHPSGELARTIRRSNGIGHLPDRLEIRTYDTGGLLIREEDQVGDDPPSITTITNDTNGHASRRDIDSDGDGTANSAVTVTWGIPSNQLGNPVPPADWKVTQREFDTDMDSQPNRAEYYLYTGRRGARLRATLVDEDMDGVADRVTGSSPYDLSRCRRVTGMFANPQLGRGAVIADIMGRQDCECRTRADVGRCGG